jgi:hypothetical protein
MTLVAVGGLAVYIMDIIMSDSGASASAYLVFYRNAVLSGEYWRMISFIFVPGGGGLFTLLMLYVYHWMGRLLETEWGRLKFNIYFFTGVLMLLVYGFATGEPLTASQLKLSLILAIGAVAPDMQIRLYLVVPVKMKWLAMLGATGLIISALMTDSLLPFVPIVNFLLFFYPQLKKLVRQSGQKKTADFRRERRRSAEEAEQRSYRYICAVCGLTDIQDPHMDFRYCTLCTGRKCYCRDHLFTHEHN